jgi:hypothetical protein
MISDFKIENFRLFEQIELNNLSQVNLIVGKNSAGKSALLEALLIYFTKMSTDVLVELIRARQEHWGATHLTKGYQGNSPLRHFFTGHLLPQWNTQGFKLSSGEDLIHVTTAAYVVDKSSGIVNRRQLSINEFDENDIDFYEPFVVFEHQGTTKIVASADDNFTDLVRKRRLNRAAVNTIVGQYVPTYGMNDREASMLWDGISLTTLEKEVLNGIKLIEPMATGITFVTNSGGSAGRIPLVKIANMDMPVPLKSLGDGMTRVFHIILSLVCAKDGILLVDEFENGLHWSIQNDVWAMVFKLAKRLNVQVFCSTHSRDCIKSFHTTWNDYHNSGGFFRVARENSKSSIKAYDLELLGDSVETDVEVR